jgi:hypothetical protein
MVIGNGEEADYSGRVLFSQFYIGSDYPKYCGRIECIRGSEVTVKVISENFTGALKAYPAQQNNSARRSPVERVTSQVDMETSVHMMTVHHGDLDAMLMNKLILSNSYQCLVSSVPLALIMQKLRSSYKDASI